MTEELFKKLKIAINNEKVLSKLKKKRLIEAKELEQSENVRRYLELCGIQTATNFIEKVNEENVEMQVFNSFLKNIEANETKKIFVYAGTYQYDGSGMIKVKANSIYGEYRKYFDIEQLEPFFLPIEECEKFEKENLVIVAEVDSVRKTFLNEALENGQEKALVYVKNKYKTRIR